MADGEVLDIRKLIQDPVYRTFLGTAPILPHVLPDSRPWYFYLKQEWAVHGDPAHPQAVTGTKIGWKRKACGTYHQAYGLLREHYKAAHDTVITCRVMPVGPPLDERRGKPWNWHKSPELARYDFSIDYKWCGYCRRPTRFRFFSRHHAVIDAINDEKRCEVCGVRERMVR